MQRKEAAMTIITAKTAWLVEPLNAYTNECISSQMRESLGNEDICVRKEPDGTEHHLWELQNYATLQVLLRNAKILNFKFRTFEQHTPNGFVYIAPLWAQPQPKKKLRKPKLIAASRL